MRRMMKRKSLLCLLVILLAFPTQTAYARTSEVGGIDVSFYNGTVDWDAVAMQDMNFVMIKTGDGKQTGTFEEDIDSQFEANYAGAGAVGIKRGVYHICCTRTPEDAVKEAEYCLAILAGRPLEYPVAYDMERPGTFAGGRDNTTAIARAFCEVIQNAGYTPMIYSTADHLSNDFDWEQLSGYKVWVAHYDVDEPRFAGEYDIWQYTQSGSIAGANTNNGKGGCDLNYSFMEADDIWLEQEHVTLGIGENYTVKALIAPDGCTDSVQWSCDDHSVATVSQSGKITAKAKGRAVITAKTGSGCETEFTVSVKKAPKSVKFKETSRTLKVGKTLTLKPVLSSGSASNKITYTSSDKKVATVSAKGIVKAKKKGTATLTVKTYNSKTAAIKITVK